MPVVITESKLEICLGVASDGFINKTQFRFFLLKIDLSPTFST